MATRLYSYLLSSLPLLRLGDRPFYSTAQFLALCQPHLEPAELAALEHASLTPAASAQTPCERRWYEFEVYLRNRLVAARAARLNTDSALWRKPESAVFPGSNRAIEEAFAAPTPLARERALDSLRWQYLEDLQAEKLFGFSALVAYRLKLLLAEKWAAQELARSEAALEQGVTAVVQQARSLRQTDTPPAAGVHAPAP